MKLLFSGCNIESVNLLRYLSLFSAFFKILMNDTRFKTAMRTLVETDGIFSMLQACMQGTFLTKHKTFILHAGKNLKL